MLLRAIEEKIFFRLGSDKETQSDFQLIAGTNKDLREAVRTGRFRDDLLARINHWTFKLPASKTGPKTSNPTSTTNSSATPKSPPPPSASTPKPAART
jgi:transcriptional regulatory protein RtcR